MHSRDPRSAPAAGTARRAMVSRPARGTESGADGRDRPRARALSSPDRRRVREGASASMVIVTPAKVLRPLAAAIVLFGALAAAAPAQQPPADLVVINARIVTVDAAFRTV